MGPFRSRPDLDLDRPPRRTDLGTPMVCGCGSQIKSDDRICLNCGALVVSRNDQGQIPKSEPLDRLGQPASRHFLVAPTICNCGQTVEPGATICWVCGDVPFA